MKNVLIEVGLEELPARFVDSAETQLKEKTAEWLKTSRISYHSLTSYSTPRRFAVVISEIGETQTTIEEEVRGPAVAIAKDDEGNWSKAAIGFAKGQGKNVEDLVEKDVNGKTYVFIKKKIEGKKTIDILPEFKKIIESIQFGNNMRWGTESLRYARPIRWITAIYGEQVIPFEIAKVQTGNTTYGHRYLGSEAVIADALKYEQVLEKQYVIVDAKRREAMILDGIRKIEEENGYRIFVEKDLLDEVRNLVEYPTVFAGAYEEAFLKLPQEVLIISMKEHQRYFPVKSQDNELLPYFIGVRNGDNYALENVIKGNEKVLRARLADAEFFFEEDQKHSIDHYLEKLKRVVFQEKLGTTAEKVQRVTYIAERIADKLKLNKNDKNHLIRAAQISKFDLSTNMVDEFPELQGVIGEIYANNLSEDEAVAAAIREHYLPKQAQGELPNTTVSAVLSVADKIDTIVGIIAVGLTPTGSQDPYALRRQASGVLRILQERNWDLTLEDILSIAEDLYYQSNITVIESLNEKLHEFFVLRVSFLLKDIGIEQDIIQALIVNNIGNFNYLAKKAKLLSAKRQDPSFKKKEEALVRILNLADKGSASEIDSERFETDSEKELYEQFKEVKTNFKIYNVKQDTAEAFNQLEKLADPIHVFFDNNMVMAEDMEIRKNRLALVLAISKLIKEFADLSLIEWKQNFN